MAVIGSHVVPGLPLSARLQSQSSQASGTDRPLAVSFSTSRQLHTFSTPLASTTLLPPRPFMFPHSTVALTPPCREIVIMSVHLKGL